MCCTGSYLIQHWTNVGSLEGGGRRKPWRSSASDCCSKFSMSLLQLNKEVGCWWHQQPYMADSKLTVVMSTKIAVCSSTKLRWEMTGQGLLKEDCYGCMPPSFLPSLQIGTTALQDRIREEGWGMHTACHVPTASLSLLPNCPVATASLYPLPNCPVPTVSLTVPCLRNVGYR